MSTPKRILIVGASRGIGLGLTREFAQRGWHVVASERSTSDDLHAVSKEHDGAVEIVTIDVTQPASYDGLAERMGDQSFDAIIVNAGIKGADHQSAEAATREEIAHVMLTNAFGPPMSVCTQPGCSASTSMPRWLACCSAIPLASMLSAALLAR